MLVAINEAKGVPGSSTHTDSPPAWVKSTKTSWAEADKVFINAGHSIRGDERVDACFDLARFDAKELILSEIANDVKGSLDNATQSISENAEVILGKVRSGEFSGKLTGLRFLEQYYERYAIGETERVDCHTLASISKADYDHVKQSVLYKLVEADPRLKEAITNKQVNFFKGSESDE